MKTTIHSLALTAIFAAASFASTLPSITLSQTSSSVRPGDTVGFGFTLTNNDDSDWVVLTGSEFTGSQTYGTYTHFLSLASAPLYVAGPAPKSATVTRAFDSANMLGVGEISTFATDPSNALISGDILLHYSLFSADPNGPNFNPYTATLVADATVSNVISVNISPEPASMGLCALALALASAALLKRRGPTASVR